MEKASHRNIFLTFDMDWASDEVLAYFYDLLCELDVCGTIHVTHETDLLNIFRKDNRLELGIHPNYNMLLDGVSGAGTYEEVLSKIHQIVPEAVTVRNHCLTTGSRIMAKQKEYGLKYDLNMLYPPRSDDSIQSFKDWNDIYRIPFIYEDDIWLTMSEKRDVQYYLSDDFSAPRVFNFHPIHIFLNSDKLNRYEEARPFFDNYEVLKKYRNLDEFGIRDFLIQLISTSKERGYTFLKIKDGNWEENEEKTDKVL